MATVDVDRLRDLMDLARDRSEQSRATLFENISDLFVSTDGRLSDRERVLMRDILAKLIGEIELEVRRSLAESLTEADDAPADLINLLANDEIAVARPILMQSQVLRDADLIEIIRQRTHEHRMAIAIRAGLTEDVSDALIERDEETVIATLVQNPDARISRPAMEYLVEQSRRLDRFQEPLLRRADLPPDLAHRMFWWVSAALRRHILTHFSIAAHDLDPHLESATDAILAAPGTARPSRAEVLAEEMYAKGLLTDRLLIQMLRETQLPMFVAGLARLLAVNLKTARYAIYEPGGEGLALACKSLEFSRSSFATIFLLTRGAHEGRAGSQVTDPTRLSGILRFYDSLSRTQSRVALSYWRRDNSYLQAIDDVETSDAVGAMVSA